MLTSKSNDLCQDIYSDSNSKLSDSILYDRTFAVSHNKYLTTSPVTPNGMKVQRKPIPSRIDYNFFNYCSTCELKYPKIVLRCKDCNQKVRTRPWHRSRIVDRRRI